MSTPLRKKMPDTCIGNALEELSQCHTITPVSTSRKRASEGLGRVQLRGERRSGRLAGRTINFCETAEEDGTAS